MSITIKSKEDIKNLKVAGKILAKAIQEVAKNIKEGISTYELDKIFYNFVIENKARPAFLNYKPFGAEYPYPASLCVSVNEEIVHGIPSKKKIIRKGDIVSIDGGVEYNGMIADHAISIICGEGSDEDKELLEITKKSLLNGIKEAKAGNRVSDISKAIEKTIPKKYGIVKELSGHGVGYKVHEEPYVPNYYDGNKGVILKEGMVLAIEPMINLGTDEIELLEDGYTFVTLDRKKSAHFEHTILVTKNGGEIITIL